MARLRIVIHRHEGQLVDPGSDVALGVDVAARRARAQRNAQDAVPAQRHGAGQRGDLAVVHHLQRDVVPGLPDFEEHIPDAPVEHVRRHTAEQRRHLHAVVHIDPRRAAANRIHPRQMRRRLLERIHDAVIVILRVRLEIRVPDRLVAEHHLALDHRRHLAVAAAEVEADAAPVQVPPQRARRCGVPAAGLFVCTTSIG